MSQENYVLLISPQEASSLNDFQNGLKESIGVNFSWNSLGTFSEIPEFFSKNRDPNFVVVDATREGFAKIPEASMNSLFSGLKVLDPHCLVLLLVDREMDSEEVISWFDRGLAGFFVKGQEGIRISDSVIDLLQARMKLKRQSMRVASKHEIRVKAPFLEQAIVAETITLGTGGMFLREIPQGAQVGDVIDFFFDDNSGAQSADDVLEREAKNNVSETSLKGRARIVWMRRLDKKDLPAGMGLQFLDLESSLQAKIEELVHRQRRMSFIPAA